jgi:phosphate transport system protein
VNRLEVEIDDHCMRILARRQPVASDLRFLTIALKLVTDLERMGDLVESICERVIELNAESPLKPYLDLPLMAETVQGMVRQALDAFVARDVARAQEVIQQDSVVDAFYAQIFRELLTYMLEDPRNIGRAIRVQAIGKHLERIGDHATNLAELVVFMVKGKDPRHAWSSGDPARARMPRGVLFLCRHNQARSQMAEGLARKLTRIQVWSAGSAPATVVHPLAVQVMAEVGIDISRQRPKSVSDVPLGDIDTVITLCAEECPVLPAPLKIERWEHPDPAAAGAEEEMVAAFRRVRDELRERIAEWC